MTTVLVVIGCVKIIGAAVLLYKCVVKALSNLWGGVLSAPKFSVVSEWLRNIMRRVGILLLASVWMLCSSAVFAAPPKSAQDALAYNLKYQVEIMPEFQGARVTLFVNKGDLLNRIEFSTHGDLYTSIKANGKLTLKNEQAIWELPKDKGVLSYLVKLTHERDSGKFDAIVNQDWAVFRGDDLVPAIHTYEKEGAYSIAKMEVILPKTWKSIETGWPRKKGNVFAIDNPDRRFDRPTGWMLAGKIGTRRATVAKTAIAVSAPIGQHFQRMDALVFLSFVWPEVRKAFGETPDKLLIVGAGDPMWRGGLSASNSLFLHADRPLVSENGTSPLLHELTHMVTRISGETAKETNDDWIAEGLAEFYSIELLYRAHGITKSRRAKIMAWLNTWGGDVKHLRNGKSTGPITARAVVLLDEINSELRTRSNDKYSLDNVVRILMQKRKVSLADLEAASQSLVGAPLKAFNSPLLH